MGDVTVIKRGCEFHACWKDDLVLLWTRYKVKGQEDELVLRVWDEGDGWTSANAQERAAPFYKMMDLEAEWCADHPLPPTEIEVIEID